MGSGKSHHYYSSCCLTFRSREPHHVSGIMVCKITLVTAHHTLITGIQLRSSVFFCATVMTELLEFKTEYWVLSSRNIWAHMIWRPYSTCIFFDSLGARVRAIGARAVYSITSLTILVVWCAAILFSLSETGAEFTL